MKFYRMMYDYYIKSRERDIPCWKFPLIPPKIWSTKSQKQICKTLEAIPSAAFCFLDLMLITRHSLCYVHYFELSAIRSSSIRDSLHLSRECLFSYVELDLSNRFGNFIKHLVGNVASRWRGYFQSIVLSTRVTGREKKTRSKLVVFFPCSRWVIFVVELWVLLRQEIKFHRHIRFHYLSV